MREQITSELKRIEKKEDIKILFAVESGSRAWGFPSKDSDYDVRFVYIHTTDWYLSVESKRDVLEYPISNLLDISGWDIRKAFSLFRKSNPSLMEWMNSPILYLEQFSTLKTLKDMSPVFFNPKANIYHYLNMATDNYRTYLQGDNVKVKKYFYVLRPILACKWLESRNSLPPMSFQELLETQIEDIKLSSEIKRLLERKMAGDELDLELRIDIISNYLDEQIQYYKKYASQMNDKELGDITVLDELFRKTLKEVLG